MSRVAKSPISIPSGVEVQVDGNSLLVKGPKGKFDYSVHEKVAVSLEGGELKVGISTDNVADYAMAGTMRALIANMVKGVSEGFERKLNLVGVGYRAQGKGNVLSLSLGFSHPVEYSVPEGITVETPTQTEIVVKGCDKQLVGKVASDIRAYRPPEPYKGKGVKYSDEQIIRKEAKKK